MKVTIQGKRYDSARCEKLGKHEHHKNGLYCGTTYLLRAANGDILCHTESNGQDCWLSDNLCSFDGSNFDIDDFYFTDEQEQRVAELGLITIV